MHGCSSNARFRAARSLLPLLFVAALAGGCGTGDDHPSQLQPIQSGASAGPGGGTSTSTTTGSGAFEVCECVAAIDASAACGQCVYDAVFLGGKPCAAEAELCNQDPGCLGMLTCLSGCHSPCCIDACLVGFTGEDALPNFRSLYTCTCEACSTECAYPDEIQCIADGEQGGTDGCGGEGGGSASGAGGAGGGLAAGGAGGN